MKGAVNLCGSWIGSLFQYSRGAGLRAHETFMDKTLLFRGRDIVELRLHVNKSFTAAQRRVDSSFMKKP